MSAALLREAANLMRERANAVVIEDGCDWYDESESVRALTRSLELTFGTTTPNADAYLMVSFGPVVARVIADWLGDECARDAEDAESRREGYLDHVARGIDIARAYLGRPADTAGGEER